MQEIEDHSQLRCAVAQAYSAAAHRPQDQHPFPVGRGFALSLGYPQELLDSLPPVSVDAFAGVSSVSVLAELPSGSRVLDLGCGAGLDSLIAARRVGAQGRVMGMDFSRSMLQRARQGVTEAGLSNIEVCQADAAGLPLADASVDGALVNGIFNLNPQRAAIFQELARVLRPGGWVYAAEIILRGPLPPEVKQDRANWFAWITGAGEGGAFLNEFLASGFREAVIRRTTRNARTKNPAVLAAEVYARR